MESEPEPRTPGPQVRPRGLGQYLRCWSARNVLDLHADGRLGPRSSAAVSRHLAACRDCADEAEALVRPSALADLGPAPVPPGLAQAILAGIESPGEDAPALHPVPAPDSWDFLRLSPAHAAALALIALLSANARRAEVAPQSLAAPAAWEWEAPR